MLGTKGDNAVNVVAVVRAEGVLSTGMTKHLLTWSPGKTMQENSHQLVLFWKLSLVFCL
jgi:hypothetical protein